MRAWQRDLQDWAFNCAPAGDAAEGSEDEQEFDYETVDPETAAEEAAYFLINLKTSNRLNATETCKLCFWLSKAGIGGIIRELAVRPDRHSSNYSKHFDLVIHRHDPGDQYFYEVHLPSTSRAAAGRVVNIAPVLPPFKAI